MPNNEPIVWGIHAGEAGNAEFLFLKKNYIAVGWSRVGNLQDIEPDREAFKAKVMECYPEKKRGAIPVYAGVLYRFLCVIRPGDIVVYPSKLSRQVHIGRITGPYKYDPALLETYPNLRPVEWSRTVPRTHFTQGALYEIGSAVTLFQIRNYAEEFIDALAGRPPEISTGEDETVVLVTKDIEETTRDFVLKQLSTELMLAAMGYRARIGPEGPDGGVDIIAHKDELGFEPPIIKVQVKSTGGSVGDPVASALYGKVAQGEYGLLVTLGKFTAQAEAFAKSKTNLRLIDGEGLVELILQHYEQFDASYKGLIPLKRVYVPEVLEESDE
ncbi:MAG: restriction endonuclease [Candidatus Lindowbacteria bacterium]|nr:restriction endonuclease [Candidatus Lindowbacteria bacterium]